jgi:LysM repeat protein
MLAQLNKKSTILILIVMALVILVQTAAADTNYTVRPGDTLAAIARRFGTTIQALAETNRIVNPNLIFVDQVLLIPTGSNPAPAPVPAPAPSPGQPGTTYVVQRGDTLFGIALRFGVSVQTLGQANGLANLNLIYVGQVLTIPGTSAPPPAPLPTPIPAAPTPTPQPPPPQPQPTQPPPTQPPPITGVNILPNPSFEEGWYNQNGLPELQLPNRWYFEYDEGPNPLDPAPWNAFVRPETRVLPAAQLPSHERPLFIYDGSYTVKIFKGYGAISIRLMTDVALDPGTYEFKIKVFPDLVQSYDNGTKVWASDPQSGEVRFIIGNGGSGWLLPTFGQKNTLTHTFTVSQSQTVRVGVALRGRYALPNNGFFMDDWSLKRVGN